MKIIKAKFPNEVNPRDVLIDDDDYERVNQYHWHYQGMGDSGTTRIITIINKTIYNLPNFILELQSDIIIDHKDRNRLNNQKENLRPCTKIQNGANRGLNANNKSGYKGVSWNKRDNCYQVMIKNYGKKIYITNTKDPIVAAKAYDTKAIELFGEFANLNFPDSLNSQ
jgi:AP2 domain.